jgi:hypothetical protein
LTSARIPKGSRSTRKRGKNRVNFPKGVKTRTSMKQMSIIMKFWTSCSSYSNVGTIICLNEFFQTKPKIIVNVLQHICIYEDLKILGGTLCIYTITFVVSEITTKISSIRKCYSDA